MSDLTNRAARCSPCKKQAPPSPASSHNSSKVDESYMYIASISNRSNKHDPSPPQPSHTTQANIQHKHTNPYLHRPNARQLLPSQFRPISPTITSLLNRDQQPPSPSSHSKTVSSFHSSSTSSAYTARLYGQRNPLPAHPSAHDD